MKSQEGKSTQGIQVQKPVLPKGGGTVQGMGETFAPNSFNGSSAMTIPIPASPCREFEPHLSLNYSSGNGNSPFGMSWNLSTPEIVRRTSLKIPNYDGTDVFLYTASDYMVPRLTPEGEPMTSTTQIGNDQYKVYFFIPCKEAEFDKIERHINVSDPSDDFWKVITAENTVSVFGKSATAKIADPENPTRIFKWLIEETYNDKGDHQVYVYQKENGNNVPTNISEVNRNKQTQSYLSSVYYGNFNPVTDGSIVTGESKIGFVPDQWHFQIAFDYGVYNIDPGNPDPHTIPGENKWPCRTDPFSDYSSGFEIRTYRLCQNILLFHHFDAIAKNAVLVTALQLNYSTGSLFTQQVSDYSVLTQLVSIMHTGYCYTGSKQSPYETKSIPELLFDYTVFQPLQPAYQPHAFEEMLDESGQNIRQANNAPFYQLIDLYGEGIPGILYQDGQSVFYRSPVHVGERAVTYRDPVPVNFPIAGKISPDHLLTDITGRGRLDLALTAVQLAGFWEMTENHGWKNFIPFQSFPTNYHYPLNNFTDVTGDGVADVVLINENEVQYNASLTKAGYDAIKQTPNTGYVPAGKYNSPTELLFFADLIGSGLSQRVRVTRNSIDCWPNLGHGLFGEKVEMLHSPDFGPNFDTNRVLWADINGSGLADLAYIHPTHIDIYYNLSGNGFSADPVKIPFPANWDELSQISFADVKGNGTNCLVFVQTHPEPNILYYDFNLCENKDGTQSSQKPYLLCTINNNMGAVTKINYAASTKFYLKDKQKGTPWITCLPFPVNVIESVTHSDAISHATTCNTWRYCHGHYDSQEKVFRGFGRVDTINAGSFAQFISQNGVSPAAYNSPDLVTRTWYHTGAFQESSSLVDQYKKEFWRGDAQAMPMNYTRFSFLSRQPQTGTLHDAHRALYGTVLRSEVYGYDDSQWANTPYTVSESEFEIREVQQKFNNLYSSFVLHERQNIRYNYERNANDPRIEHEFVLNTDFYGHTLEECSVNYPRRSVAVPAGMGEHTKGQQLLMRVSCAVESVFNSNEADVYWNITPPAAQTNSNGYLLGISTESKRYELNGLTTDLANGYFSWEGIKTQIASALSAQTNCRLLSWNRNYFYDAARQVELPLYNLVAPVLSHRIEFVEFDIAQLGTDFSNCLTAEQMAQLLTAGSGTNGTCGGYVAFNAIPPQPEDNYYWNPGSRQHYFSSDQFFLPSAFYDARGNSYSYEYDSYNFFAQKLTDPLGNVFQISWFDYRYMQPVETTDSNGIISSVLLDALGVVIAVSGTGFSPLSGFTPFSREHIEAAFLTPSSVLSDNNWMSIKAFFYYDLHSWKNHQEPVHFKVIQRNYFVDEPPQNGNHLYQLKVLYQDAFGRVAQQKSFYDGGNQWQTSGIVRYDNKGQAIEKFNPFFDTVAAYNLHGGAISELFFYDALGRLVLTKRYNASNPSAEDFFTKTLFGYLDEAPDPPVCAGYLNTKLYANLGSQTTNGITSYYVLQPSAWFSLQYDENDCISDSLYQPKAEKNIDEDAWTKALKFANTPFLSVEDSMGNVVQKGQLNVPEAEQNNNYFTFDIKGDELTSADQRLHPQHLRNFVYSYSLGKEVVKTISVDAGTKWQLQDVMGNVIFNCDARNTQEFSLYDPVNRLSSLYISNSSPVGKLPPLSQTTRMIIYGDSQSNDIPYFSNPEALNLRGKPVITLDEAGLVISPSFDINGHPLMKGQWVKGDYQQEADWNTITNNVIAELIPAFLVNNKPDLTNVQLPSALSALLDPDYYVTSAGYNALGQLMSSVDADDNEGNTDYYCNGWIRQHSAKAGPLVQKADPTASLPGFSDVQYNEKGLRTSIQFANNAKTTYTYDEYSYELIRIKTTKNKTDIIQDLHYHHDPAGNITSVRNKAIPTVFFGNQKVEALSGYTYNSLYRLVSATGREHQGLWQNVQTNQNKFNKNFLGTLFGANGQPISNPQTLQNYTQQFTYDAGGNLTRMQKPGNNAYTRINTIASGSNQITVSSVGSSPATNYSYDTSGNMTSLDGCAYVTWNYRNNMQSAVILERPGEHENDTEYYMYDSGGRRVRKVFRQKAQSGWTIKETLYVGGIEIHKTYAETPKSIKKEWHNLKQRDGEGTFCVWQYWITGVIKPDEKKVQLRYQLNDVLNSSCYELDQDAALITYEEYYRYGGTSIVAAENETEVKNKHYHYSFREKDNVTGLYYYGMRYYVPWLGRWTCTDPSGPHHTLNIYLFVSDDPSSYIDYLGYTREQLEAQYGAPQVKEWAKQIDSAYKHLSSAAAAEFDVLEAKMAHEAQTSGDAYSTDVERKFISALEKHKVLSFIYNPVLADLWTDALGKITNLGEEDPIDTYKKARGHFTGLIKDQYPEIGYDKLKKSPEIHHVEYKAVNPKEAISYENLLLVSRGDTVKIGQHDRLHQLTSAGSSNSYVDLPKKSRTAIKKFRKKIKPAQKLRSAKSSHADKNLAVRMMEQVKRLATATKGAAYALRNQSY